MPQWHLAGWTRPPVGGPVDHHLHVCLISVVYFKPVHDLTNCHFWQAAVNKGLNTLFLWSPGDFMWTVCLAKLSTWSLE